MAEYRTVRLIASYANTSFKRNYELDIDPDNVDTVKEKVLAINSSIAAGTSGGMDSFFVSDNGDQFVGFSSAQIISVSEEAINLEGSN